MAGVELKTWYNRKYFSKQLDPIIQYRHRDEDIDMTYSYNNDNKITYKNYLIARKNLIEFVWVGLVDKFEDGLIQFETFFGKKLNDKDKHLHNNVGKTKKRNLTDIEIKLLHKYNKYDLDLYALSKVLFEQQQLVIQYNDCHH